MGEDQYEALQAQCELQILSMAIRERWVILDRSSPESGPIFVRLHPKLLTLQYKGPPPRAVAIAHRRHSPKTAHCKGTGDYITVVN